MGKRLSAIFVDAPLSALSVAYGALGGATGVALVPLMNEWVAPFYGVAIGLYVALFVSHHNEKKSKESLESELETLRHSSPLIELQEIRGPSKLNLTTRDGQPRKMEMWQLWFKNEPVIRSTAAVARDLSAMITFCDDEWRQVLPSYVGQWASTKEADHMGFNGLSGSTDLKLTLMRAKLVLLSQGRGYMLDGERGVYGLAGENFHEYPDGTHPKYRLKPNATRVKVVLQAENMETKEFRFKIEREANGTVTGITRLQ